MSEPNGNRAPREPRLSVRLVLAGAPRGLLLSLIALTAGAWALTLYEAFRMRAPNGMGLPGDAQMPMDMAGMTSSSASAAGWSLAGALAFPALWTVMMTARMLPSAGPMILVFDAAQRRQRELAVPTPIFVAGYILVWAGAGALVYGLVQIA